MSAKKNEAAPPPERDATAEEVADPAYWEKVYNEESPPGWDIGEPSPPLIRFFEDDPKPPVKPGRAIVPGCGYGHDALYLAKRGFNVVAVDCAAPAIERVRARAEEEKLDVEALQADLFDLPKRFAGAFDYVIEHTCFCAIHPSRRADYAKVMHGLLKPDGQLIGLFYHHQRPGGPPYDVTPEEVRTTFEPLFHCRTLVIASGSIERRDGKELLARFWKK
ncbi:MAG: TPMT family class I SAM-dependent methyltransferase [Planctomycetes bacterium]|nr:TPMT family class I SAM-dependent methyltransferase [Planctomycetota bacterium]